MTYSVANHFRRWFWCRFD